MGQRMRDARRGEAKERDGIRLRSRLRKSTEEIARIPNVARVGREGGVPSGYREQRSYLGKMSLLL